jgi:hypothetical protein
MAAARGTYESSSLLEEAGDAGLLHLLLLFLLLRELGCRLCGVLDLVHGVFGRAAGEKPLTSTQLKRRRR